VLLAVIVPLGWVRARSRRAGRAQRPPRSSQFASTRQPKMGAALEEWRGMREALKAAEHTRFAARGPAAPTNGSVAAQSAADSRS
jgi:hypothetical protein